VVTVQRGDRLLLPDPSTVLEVGDVVSALVHRSVAPELSRALGAREQPTAEVQEEGPDLV
jgi:Trk K+ transport system NAD-binding subunit